MITQAPRGTKDWFGRDMQRRTAIEKKIREIVKTYDIKEISTPVFEHTVLFERGVGETTDVVSKEMYTFTDKGGRSVTLKPEGTAGAVRAYVENGMFSDPAPKKLFYVTPAYRYEKPQSGRLREHHQFGVEIIGSESPLVEAELISLVRSVLNAIGLKDAKLHINSIGCANCRKAYNKKLLEYLSSRQDGLCPVCRQRMQKNPLRVIDCKEPGCKQIIKDAPRTIDFLDEECSRHFESLKGILDDLGIGYEVDSGIVRGLDYYTKTVFEFVNSEGLTLCGGGRYDNLVKEIDGKRDIPSAGFGMGIERLLYFLDREGAELEDEPAVDLYIGAIGGRAATAAFSTVLKLREKGFVVETDYMERSVKAQMKYANRIGARFSVIIGDDELESGNVTLKNMETGENVLIPISKLCDHI